MDPLSITALASLASQVVGILIPIMPVLGTVRDSVANKIGEDIYDEGKKLFAVINTRFTKEVDGKASKVLQNFADDPKEYKLNLEKHLLALLQTDPDFAQMLRHILQTGPIQTMNFGEDTSVKDTHMRNALGQGTQQMTSGNRTIFEDVSMDIGPKKE